jgi:hypothetical protein
MAEQSEENRTQNTPPYFSGTTFYNFVDAHRRTQPTRFDRSIMQNVAGGDQARILKALRFFDMMDDESRPNVAFEMMQDLDADDLQRHWAELLKSAYPFLFSGFNLEKATQGQIEERFREQGIQGDTVRKAVTFFITLARLAGLKLSPYFKASRQRGPRGPRGNRPPRRTRQTETPTDNMVAAQADPASPTRSAKTIHFRSGGTATLTVSVDVVNLSSADRTALFEWIDAMNKYESEAA